MALRGGTDIVVATPGRLLDLVEQRALALDRLHMLVLDEADRLLDSGFSEELQRVLALLPSRRQSLLLSATFPAAVQALVKSLLHEPQHIAVATEAPGAEPPTQLPAGITQRAIRVDTALRTPLLRQLIATEAWSRVLVFVASQYASELVADKLRRHGIAAAAFHGDLAQATRQQVLADFKAGRLQAVVSTDLAARGIDITELPVVVNHDLARSAVDHLHRIGRTGRAGASGLAVSFIRADQPQAEAHFRLIEKRQGQRIVREQIAGFEPTAPSDAPPSAGGIKGKRKSKKDKLREAAVTIPDD